MESLRAARRSRRSRRSCGELGAAAGMEEGVVPFTQPPYAPLPPPPTQASRLGRAHGLGVDATGASIDGGAASVEAGALDGAMDGAMDAAVDGAVKGASGDGVSRVNGVWMVDGVSTGDVSIGSEAATPVLDLRRAFRRSRLRAPSSGVAGVVLCPWPCRWLWPLAASAMPIVGSMRQRCRPPVCVLTGAGAGVVEVKARRLSRLSLGGARREPSLIPAATVPSSTAAAVLSLSESAAAVAIATSGAVAASPLAACSCDFPKCPLSECSIATCRPPSIV